MESQHYGRVYLLHFEPAYKHAQHYLGMADIHTIDGRIKTHLRGSGSPLVRAAVDAGSTITLTRVWQTYGRHHAHMLERRLKHSHMTKLCPLCNPAAPRWGNACIEESNHQEVQDDKPNT